MVLAISHSLLLTHHYLLTLGIIWFLSKEKTNPEVTVVTTPLGCREIQLVETWEFIWWSTDGGYYRGQKSGGPYEVRIMQNTSEALWFDVFYQYDGKLQKASFELTWDGRQYAGVWSQASPKDTGNVYLRRVNGAWSGHYTNRDNVSFDCGLQLAAKK